MPLFEFQCRDCDQPFEELLRSSSAVAEVKCPTCGSAHVQRKVSVFASKVSGGGGSLPLSSSASACSTGGT